MNESHTQPEIASTDRRSFLHRAGGGVFAAAVASLLERDVAADEADSPQDPDPQRLRGLKPRKPHFPPKAKAVIQLFMNGGPSQMDLFDPKPELTRRHGQPYFNKIAGEVENPAAAGAIMRSPFKFAQHGGSGIWVSDIMPHLAQCVDDLTMVRSMHTVNLTHEPSIYMIQCGRMLPGLPTFGSWVTYGLGSENENLPAYVVLDDPRGLPINGTQNWQAGFLPPVCQGTRFRSTGSPVLNLQRGYEQPDKVAQLQDQLVANLDNLHRDRNARQPRLSARIASYELAARMQMNATQALNLTSESAKTLEMYGVDESETDSYGRRCLMARRLVERGVRFVQLYIDGQIWDNHSKIKTALPDACRRTDKPIAGLLRDLKQRGLLDSTLVLWGGEFGRLPIAQLLNGSEENAGRDHNKRAMCAWMAGGGVKQGYVHGATDELGLSAVEQRMSVSDWHATVLHLLGMDHERLVYHRHGLDEKLTGVEECRVVTDLFS